MTADEVASKSRGGGKNKEATKAADKRMGVAAALEWRNRVLEERGIETEQSKKRRKKAQGGQDRAATLKTVRGAHLLK